MSRGKPVVIVLFAVFGWAVRAPGAGVDTNCCQTGHGAGCEDPVIEACVCAADPYCCDTEWDSICVDEVNSTGCDTCAQIADNDDCANATLLGEEGATAFDTEYATTDGPELPASCDEGYGLNFNNDLWYCYTAPAAGTVTVSLCDETLYDSRLAVYEGCDCPPSGDTVVACDDDGCGSLGGASQASFAATANTGYLIRIGGFSTVPGAGVLNITGPSGGTTPCGDFTGDGSVNLADFSTFASCFGATVSAPPPSCTPADAEVSDLDGDGEVRLSDFGIFATCFTG